MEYASQGFISNISETAPMEGHEGVSSTSSADLEPGTLVHPGTLWSLKAF